MAYYINGVNVTALAETLPTTDAREATGFTTSNYKYSGYTHQDWFGTKMAMNYDGYIYSGECGIGGKYLKGGSAWFSVSKKGCRPMPVARWISSSPGMWFINKFSDGEVWVSTAAYTKSGTRISTSSENINYIYVAICGSGGGGGGSSGTVSGGGGGGGCFSYSCRMLSTGFFLRVVIHDGGAGGSGNSNGTSGTNTQVEGYRSVDYGTSGVYSFSAYGGSAGQSGGNGGGGGSGGTMNPYTPSNGGGYTYRITENDGASGGSKNNGGGSTSSSTTSAYNPENKTYRYGGGSGGGGNYGGGGAGSWVGYSGGKGGAAYEAGGSGGAGAGGGGGAFVLFSSRDGGKGGSGYVEIMY